MYIRGGGTFQIAMNSVLSHEYAEAATNPLTTTTTYAWVDSGGTQRELADMCSPIGVPGPGGAYVQALWDNNTDRCATYAASPYVAAVQSDNPIVYYRLGETSGTATNSAIPRMNPSSSATYSSGITLAQSGAIAGTPTAHPSS